MRGTMTERFGNISKARSANEAAHRFAHRHGAGAEPRRQRAQRHRLAGGEHAAHQAAGERVIDALLQGVAHRVGRRRRHQPDAALAPRRAGLRRSDPGSGLSLGVHRISQTARPKGRPV